MAVILFERTWALLGIPIWAGLVGLLYLRQRQSLAWIAENTAGPRRSQLTRYTPWSVVAHMFFLFSAGLCAVLAAAGPFTPGVVEKTEVSGNVALVLDASFSMAADDMPPVPSSEEGAKSPPAARAGSSSRFESAKFFARQLIELMPQHRFALLSFSGIPATHSPATIDHAALLTYLNTLTLHSFAATGSSFAAAFSGLLHLTAQSDRPMQAVLFSDGELPEPERFADELRALAAKGIRVHTMAVGSTKGRRLTIRHPDDLRRGRTPARPLKTVSTKRIDRELKEIASATGGTFHVLSETQAKQIQSILEANMNAGTTVRAPGRNDLSRYPVLAFLILFLVETLVISGRLSVGRFLPWKGAFLAAFAAVFTLGACDNRLHRAHVRNEQGIHLFLTQEHAQARAEFEASAALGASAEVPTYNEAGNLSVEGDLAAAHKAYERALEIEPRLLEALYNDGHALYRWGQRELRPPSPNDCLQKRTRQLWEQSLRRFERVRAEAGLSVRIAGRARRNSDFVRSQLQALDRLEESCPQSKKQQSKKEQDEKQEKQEKKEEKQEKKEQNQGPKPNESDPSRGKGANNRGEGQGHQSKSAAKAESQKGGGHGGSGGDGPQQKPNVARGTKGLSRAEQDQVEGELERIRGQARQGKRHLQSQAQQMPKAGQTGVGRQGRRQSKTGKKGSGGPAVLW